MKTVTDHLRARLLAGVEPPKRLPALASLCESEWSPEFERLMRNRLLMGAFRYGTFGEHAAAGRNGYDNVGSAIERLQAYRRTGNAEHLVDAANLCLKEWMVGDHPRRHFHAADDTLHAEKSE
jgi:hypothetical protein